MNQLFGKICNLMAEYDAAPAGTPERAEAGGRLDREASKARLSERDIANIAELYAARGKIKT